MRPHRLRVTAFGAFAGSEEVRFDELEGLFLLHGETGAGKTTLLDAIAFALYGKVPGKRAEAKRLRSDHAGPDVRTEVELEATVGGRRLRITRSPEWERPKKSGSGTTKAPALVRLEELTTAGKWELKSTRIDETGAEILDLMGMSADQFFQVVLLPQGQFAQFLHAGAEARAELLQRLFGTDRFRAVEKWLAERRVLTAREVDAATAGVSQLMARVGQVAGVPVPEGGDAGGDPGDLPWQVTWAGGLLAHARAALEAAAGTSAVRGQELDAALAAASEAEQLADRQRRRSEALRRQASLRAEETAIKALRAELDAANRAAEVAPVLDEATRAWDAAEAAGKAADRARAFVPSGVAPDDAPAKVLEAAARDQEARFVRREALRSVARQAAQEDSLADSARARAMGLDASLARSCSDAARVQASRPAILLGRDEASQAAADLPAAQGRASARRQVAADLAALVRERATRDRVAEAHRIAAGEALALGKDYDRIRKARIEGMSGELAKNLFNGFPCPVCGSLDHPDPSEMPPGWVSPDEEQQADAAARLAADKAEKAGQKVAAADAVIEDLRSRLAGAGQDVPGDAAALAATAGLAEADAARLEADATRVANLAARLARLQRDLEQLDAAVMAAEKKQAELAEQRTAAQAEAEGAQRRAADCRETLRTQLDDDADLEAALSCARRLADVLTAAADALSEAARTADTAAEAGERARQAAAGAGFGAGPGERYAGVSAARAAIRDQGWRKSADARIREHEAAVDAVAALLADPGLGVALDPPAPVEPARDAVATAREEHSLAVDAQGRARHADSQLASLQPELAAALAELAPLEARAAEARRIADLANASTTANQFKMMLSAFVLAARLEEVAAAASQRLLTMTAGRYSLVHTDARRGAGRSGLGLLACDSWTGQDRDTSTLSGGETFLASLALALGLADVVTAEAAGARMEALFVDEGFGTLDEDTLEEVMTVLDGLREGGRMVGIVSHVAELRQRIPAQIQVQKGHHGSRVRVTAGLRYRAVHGRGILFRHREQAGQAGDRQRPQPDGEGDRQPV
jgi:exonuclease SbcC